VGAVHRIIHGVREQAAMHRVAA